MEEHETQGADLQAENSASIMRQGVRFLLHLAAVYATVNICCPWLAGTIYSTVMPTLGIAPTGSSFQFLFAHLFAFSFVSALVSGFVNAKYQHTVALFVWTVPVAILAYKFATFPASIFDSRFTAALHHYVGGSFLVPEFHNYRDLFAYVAPNLDARRGMDQFRFTAPVYAGIGYSLGAWVSKEGLLRKLFIFERSE
jgi:hypothetical protein